MGKIVIFFGPSTAGKSELQKSISSPVFPKLVTATTRLPREGEKDAIDYHFLSKKEFTDKIEDGIFVEWTLYSGHYYGMLRDSIQHAFESTLNYNTVMELKGLQAIKKSFPTLIKTLYVASDYSSLSRRLQERGTSEEEMEKRLFNAKKEGETNKYADFADAQVWNGDEVPFNETIANVKEILRQWDILT